MQTPTFLMLGLCAGLIPTTSGAYDGVVDLSALQNIDPSVFAPGTCQFGAPNALFYSFNCGETSNPTISIFGNVTSDANIEFALSSDIANRCENMGGCLAAEPFAYKDWTGGRFVIDGKFGFVSHTVLVSGDAVIEITSRDLNRSVAEQNADIALEQAGALLLCAPWVEAVATCSDTK